MGDILEVAIRKYVNPLIYFSERKKCLLNDA